MKLSAVGKMLKEGGIEEWKNEALILAEHFSGMSRAKLFSLEDAQVPNEVLSAVKERLSGRPLQYILGEWSFYGYPFKISEGCLIPRDDTEILVYEVLKCLPKNAVIADVCSGSGCIGISILLEREDVRCFSFDLYDVPLSLTKENGERSGVDSRLSVCKADVLGEFELPEDVTFLISNPPYIRSDAVKTLSREVKSEPHTALDGGEDGLVFYRKLIGVCREKEIPAAFEIGYDQGEELIRLANENGFECKIIKDIGGCDRVAMLKLKEK